jgi:D-beta-D-heptose 7-phosphate kinase/D-beta-D-heptose 1-phosphate adenosyltransferase
MSQWAQIVHAFRSLRVLVIGDAMLDVYLQGSASRLCPEAPVPIVDLTSRCEVPGGAANTALNLRRLGASVSLMALIGDDCEGLLLKQSLLASGIDVDPLLAVPNRRTLAKQRISSGAQLLLRFDQGDKSDPAPSDQQALADSLRRLYRHYDAVVLSDYCYGALSPLVVAALAEAQQQTPRVLVADSKRLDQLAQIRFTAVKPNYAEALRLVGENAEIGQARIDQMRRLGPRLFERVNCQLAAVTLDQDGALVFDPPREPLRTLTNPNVHSRAAGAGDTYAAALALALAAGAETCAAAEIAAAAAAVVVGKDGTSTCSSQELLRRLKGAHGPGADWETLAPCLEEHRRRGRRIVLTSGCFDLLHRGHITYLHQARSLGDVLVVGVNTDDSIRRLRGPERPINMLEDRVQVLSALGCVDHVVSFDDDTPHRLVAAVRPDVFVKGGDYTRDRLPEAALVEQLGGRVEILPLVRERSTTSIIKRIRAAPAAASGNGNGHGKAASISLAPGLPLSPTVRLS